MLTKEQMFVKIIIHCLYDNKIIVIKGVLKYESSNKV